MEKKEDKKDLSAIPDRWQSFCSSLGMLLKPMLSLCKVSCQGEGITILCQDPGSLQYVKDQQAQIASEIKKYYGLDKEPVIVFAADEGYNERDSFKEDILSQIGAPVEFE